MAGSSSHAESIYSQRDPAASHDDSLKSRLVHLCQSQFEFGPFVEVVPLGDLEQPIPVRVSLSMSS